STKQLEASVADLPRDMSKQDRRRFIAATKATINERLKYQDTVLDFEERLKLNAQLFTLENQELKLDLLDRFDVRSLLDADGLAKLQVELNEAQRQIVKQIKARGPRRALTHRLRKKTLQMRGYSPGGRNAKGQSSALVSGVSHGVTPGPAHQPFCCPFVECGPSAGPRSKPGALR